MTQSKDALVAVKKWFAKFPEFKNNSLFVSGESYGGVYVPYLTYQIWQHNRKVDSFIIDEDRINIKGMLVGNGATNWDFDATPVYPATT